MSSEEKFDAIVVGAGPSGCAAAYTLAKAGLEVLLIERGDYAGAKNVIGGILYSKVLNDLFPGFWEEAPVERHITRRVITFLSEDSAFSVDFKSQKFDQPPYNGFSILRAKFDKWLAGKAEEAGAMVVTGIKVDQFVWKDGKVAGIVAGEDEMLADVVIAADGVNSLLAKKAGLRNQELEARQIAVGVKEVIELPREVIEERFNLEGNEGIANEFVGYCTKGVQGGGFLYTNKESLSLGIVTQIDSLRKSHLKPPDLVEEFRLHPMIKNYTRGGEVAEYAAHLIPEAGMGMMMPHLYMDGLLVVGDAAALVCAIGLTLEGANFAIASGVAAAETVKQAKEKRDYSRATLAAYQKRLEESFVLQDLKTYQKASHFLENPRMYSAYPDLICHLAQKVFTVDGSPKKKISKLAREEIKGRKVSLWRLVRDMMQGGRAI